MTSSKLEQEAERATALLAGKVVKRVWRHRGEEVGIEFVDGSRLFVDSLEEGLELSITGEHGPGSSSTSIEPVPPELGPTVFFAPPNGWHGFESSSALTDIFWNNLGCWHYLNFTSDTSTWECPQHHTLAWLSFDSGDVVSELGVRFAEKVEHSSCSIHRVLDQLRGAYGLEVGR
ncbi:MAG: hypothetical protein QM756_19150 [Polyangiaceae bacterium]